MVAESEDTKPAEPTLTGSHRPTAQLMAQIGPNLRKKREEKALSREQLAEASGVSVNTIVRYEKGEIGRTEELFKLCDALEITLLDLFDPSDAEAFMTVYKYAERRAAAKTGAMLKDLLNTTNRLRKAAVASQSEAMPPPGRTNKDDPRIRELREVVRGLPSGYTEWLTTLVFLALPDEFTRNVIFQVIQSFAYAVRVAAHVEGEKSSAPVDGDKPSAPAQQPDTR